MFANVYLYVQHDPAARLKASAIESDSFDSWVSVRPDGEGESNFILGLSPEQARDLAKQLFRAAGEAEAMDAQLAAAQPQAATP